MAVGMKWTNEDDQRVLEVIQREIRKGRLITDAIDAASYECNIERYFINGRWNYKLRSKCSPDVLEILAMRHNAKRNLNKVEEEKKKIKKELQQLKERENMLQARLKALEAMEIKRLF
jgi:hypothetical protein